MNKINRLIIFLILAGLIFVLSLEKNIPRQKSLVYVKGKVFEVDIVDKADEMAKGLSGRSTLAENQGMLFIYSQDAKRSFWMKDMIFPIDILWIDDKVIVGYEQNIPPANPDTPDSQKTRYSSDKEVDMVLEISAGSIEQHNIEIGDIIEIYDIR